MFKRIVQIRVLSQVSIRSSFEQYLRINVEILLLLFHCLILHNSLRLLSSVDLNMLLLYKIKRCITFLLDCSTFSILNWLHISLVPRWIRSKRIHCESPGMCIWASRFPYRSFPLNRRRELHFMGRSCDRRQVYISFGIDGLVHKSHLYASSIWYIFNQLTSVVGYYCDQVIGITPLGVLLCLSYLLLLSIFLASAYFYCVFSFVQLLVFYAPSLHAIYTCFIFGVRSVYAY